MGVLNDQGKRTPQVLFADVPDIQAVIGDGASLYLIETVDQVDNGGFSRSGGAHKGNFLSGLGVETDAV